MTKGWSKTSFLWGPAWTDFWGQEVGSRGKLGDLHTSPFCLTLAAFNILGCNIVIWVIEGWLATLPLLIYSGTLTPSPEVTTKNVP